MSQRHGQPRIVVYTAIAGNYDSLKLPEHPDPRLDYVLFTDSPAPDTGIWQVRPITCLLADPTRSCRFVKLHPHQLLHDFDLAIWVDSSIMITGTLDALLEDIEASGLPVGAIPHPLRRTVYEEFTACLALQLDDARVLRTQRAKYQNEGFQHDDLIESNLMVFDLRDARTPMFLNMWWQEVDRHSRRDQLSLNYALRRSGLEWCRLTRWPDSARNHQELAFAEHDSNVGPVLALTHALDAPLVNPYSGQSFAEIRDQVIASRLGCSIDVVVCVHDALPHVAACLESLRRLRRSEAQRLILVDDGSKPATAKLLHYFAQQNDWVEIHRLDQPLGYSVAANLGLASSTGDFVILLNSDTVVTDGWAEKLADAVFSTPGAGIVGPMSNAASHQSLPDHMGSKHQSAINLLPPHLTAEDMNRLCEQWTTAGILPRVPLVHGFCFGITREVLRTVGLFDTESFPRGYGEENDYCLRATDAGFGLVVATHTYVFHAKSKSYPDAERVRLTRAAAKTLARLHGASRVKRAVMSMESNAILAGLREHARQHEEQLKHSTAPAKFGDLPP